MRHDHDQNHRGDDAPAAVVEVDIKNVYGGSDYAGLEVCLCDLRGVTGLFSELQRGWARKETVPGFLNLFIETGAPPASSSPTTGLSDTPNRRPPHTSYAA